MELSQPYHSLVFSSLPSEIVLLFLSNICLHCREPDRGPLVYYPTKHQEYDQPSWYALDLQALHSPCLVSRRLRHLAQPILSFHGDMNGLDGSFSSSE
ncbi:hypothetical protein F5B22DRAFT_591927 [Xylaria bambusicola]|uniref:uncharacterized protein n=1 Tax=Xylaria bambusicola TaxID=326684 RepID=UPI002007F190|nr:uncharacterized protein F5B22DRAFT_591927 [Xylaria bambusicola]KAI0523769.1 hypothetical protein F5B22DRAFT_591927 [Xylaria bambusicola]